MVELKNLDVEELECDELRTNHITCKTINGVTAKELSYLSGITSNVQAQIDTLNATYDSYLEAWSQ